MANTSETGHAKNVTNLESLITSIIALGTTYNPSRDSIKLTALQTQFDASKESLNTVNIAQAAYSNAVAARKVAFQPFSQLITRVYNSLKATDTTIQVDQNARTIVRKLQGRRASAKITEEEKKALEAEGKEVNQISASQMSFDNRIENFYKLIMLLSSVPLYNPNEEELKIEALKALHSQLKAKNTEVILPAVQLSNSRISRNKILYNENTGLVDIALDSKTYIKSIFGATSPQYKQISKLKFIRPKH
jgi:glutamyl/glutaminyl-tRNA synthetase